MTQGQALSILKSGANAFITGEPGSGKTHTVNTYVAYLRSHGIEPAITASTGVAATHLGGLTIHSWSGIGIRRSLSPYDLDAITSKEALVKRVVAARVLIIDEISMLDASVLDMVDHVVSVIKQNNQPFGGMQVVFVGDFFQLPPIPEPGEEARFAFESRAWLKANPIVCYLSEQHRQEDQAFLSLLSAIRQGEIDDSVYAHLETRRVESAPEERITRLYTHNVDVDRINQGELAELSGDVRSYTMETVGNTKLVEGLIKNCMSPEVLTLKIGAVVMFTKNNFEAGFVNGTLGTVVSYEQGTGRPVVETLDGRRITAEPMEWAIEDSGKILAKIIQMPLRLAWAITIHKSQGMSLDAASMDLGRAFEYGQGYVALSRVRTISGVYLEGLCARALEVHPRVLSTDHVFRENSTAAVTEFDAIGEEALATMHRDCILGMGGTLEAKKEKGGSKEVEITPGKKRLLDIRKKFPNAGRPWTKEDSDEMVERFERGESKAAIGKHFGRKPSAIHARLIQLGVIEDDRVFVRRGESE